MTGVVSQGATLAYGDGASPEVFTEIPGVTDIQVPGGETPSIDMSALADALGSFEPGKPKYGAVSGTVNYDPSNTPQAQLRTDWLARTKRNWRITITDISPDATFTFQAFVSQWGAPAIADDDKISLPFSLMPTGSVTQA